MKEGVVSTDEDVEPPGLAETRMPVGEIREVEREAAELSEDGREFAGDNTVEKHKGFEGDDPAARVADAGGEGVDQRFEVEMRRRADPFVDAVSVGVVDGGGVVGGGFDDGCFQV